MSTIRLFHFQFRFIIAILFCRCPSEGSAAKCCHLFCLSNGLTTSLHCFISFVRIIVYFFLSLSLKGSDYEHTKNDHRAFSPPVALFLYRRFHCERDGRSDDLTKMAALCRNLTWRSKRQAAFRIRIDHHEHFSHVVLDLRREKQSPGQAG